MNDMNGFDNHEYPAVFGGRGEGRLMVGGVKEAAVAMSFEIWCHPSGVNLPMVDMATFNELVAQSVTVLVRPSAAGTDPATTKTGASTYLAVDDSEFAERLSISDRDSLDQFVEDSFDGVFWSPSPMTIQMIVASALLTISAALLIGWLVFGRGG